FYRRPGESRNPPFNWLRNGEVGPGFRLDAMEQEDRRMQAAVMVPGREGGSWDIREVQRPTVPPGHVLLRAHASSINRAEFRRLHNFRLQADKPAPEPRVGGGDAAGEIVELGAEVSGFKAGDRAMGRCAGGFA